MKVHKYKTVFISDVHLGSRVCESDKLCEFLKENTCENLFLVGDIIDFWKLQRTIYWPQSHTNVIRRILTASKRGTKVKYILGNHDETLRDWIKNSELSLGNIELFNHFDYNTIKGKKILITHGDLFDGVIRHSKWLSVAGDRAYSALIHLNAILNKIRALMGKEYWSLSSYIKINTKQAVAFVTSFEKHLIDHAKKEGYSGVLCGHIHSASMQESNDFVYMNTGDWCETISAIVEEYNGDFVLLVWNSRVGKLMEKARWVP